jgi:hypothetical protein
MFGKLFKLLRQTLCGLRGGHDHVKHFTKTVVNLRCMKCQHETRGWTTGGRLPRHRYDGDKRHIMLKPVHRRM